LPKHCQNQMCLLLNERYIADSRKLETDTLRGIDRQIQVLFDLVNIKILLHVKCAQINGAFDCQVDQFAEHYSVFHGGEDVIVLGVEGEELLQVLVRLEELVCELSEANSLLDEI
jgi:hypothetical protein